MFKKILIANRGEIACRIIHTAKKMGIQTIAVYSEADKNSQHVRLADEAYLIGESPAIKSYLNSEAILEVAKKSNACAIHPGYGFLSENPQFAQNCLDANIVFIGPSVEAMLAMASKQFAKQLLEKTKVPLTPGYHGADQSDTRLLAESKTIGFPVLLKAAAGGGGKGMRVVEEESAFAQALASARREALASFADDTMIVEKLITQPRHIEVQILADNFGEVIHLFERDCSVQRRHQKVIEEAPALHLPKMVREKLCDAASEVARSIQYRGAGTVEFLLDKNNHFYFMEMNTRLQVEHPVTEMITGVDLVECQIQIAANQPLAIKQSELKIKGHALECRIYAEDPENGFLPSIGQIHFLKTPQGPGIRIDSGIVCGSFISQYYDPMIAKLIVHGETREDAVFKMQQALKAYHIGGVKNNIAFLQSICNHPLFIKAAISTDFLSKEKISLIAPNKELALLMGASYHYLTLIEQQKDPLFLESFAWQMHLPGSWDWSCLLNDALFTIKINPQTESKFLLQFNEKTYSVFANKLVSDCLVLEYEGLQHKAYIESCGENINVYLEEGLLTLSAPVFNAKNETNLGHLTAPMPATIVAILKKAGDRVKQGEQLLVLEAMKMEHTICAPKDGILAQIFYPVGAQVNEGAELMALQD